MISFTGMGRFASIAVIAGSLALGAVSAKAQDVPAEHMQEKIDLGRSRFRNFQRRVSAAG